MKWHNGGVSTAIVECKATSALFVVFVESDDEKGHQMASLWDGLTPEIIAPTQVVALQLAAGSQEAKQFAAIYPTPILPVSYIIDLHGKPLEAITLVCNLTQDQFTAKVTKACQAFQSSSPPLPQSSSPVESSPSIPPPETSSTSAELAEKIRKAKEALEKIRAEEADKKIQEEKEKELERRESAKQMQKTAEDRRNKELIDAAAQRRKEKVETEKEKKRVMEQIKKDREEQKERAARMKEGEGNIQPDASSSSLLQEMEKNEQPRGVVSDRCRVQLRFPDGSNALHEFPSGDALASLRQIVSTDSRIGSCSFRLAQPVPRRVYTDDEYDKTFIDLGLTPASTLLVLVDASPSVLSAVASPASPVGGIFHLFSLLLWTPIQYILSFLGYGQKNATGIAKKEEGQRRQNVRGPGEGSGDTEERRQRGVPPGAEIRQRGNVRTLYNDETRDAAEPATDDEANWNGNSTQFL